MKDYIKIKTGKVKGYYLENDRYLFHYSNILKKMKIEFIDVNIIKIKI
jgi:hypothetical protein